VEPITHSSDVDLELRHMRLVVVLAQELNFTRAAARLGLAQSALSAQVRRIEGHLGVALFDRSTRGTSLTWAGRDFVTRAQHVLAQAEDLERHTRRTRSPAAAPRTLRVVAETVHPRVVTSLAERHPRMSVTLRHDSAEDGLAALVDDDADLCHGWDLPTVPLRMPRGVAQATLVDEPMWAVLPIDHPLATEPRISLNQLRTDDWICPAPGTRRARHLLAVCQAAGFVPTIRYVVDDQDMVRDLLAGGSCVDIAPPRQLPQEGCRAVPLFEDVRARLFYAWHEDRVPGWLARQILDDSRAAFLASLEARSAVYLGLVREDPVRFATLVDPDPPGWPPTEETSAGHRPVTDLLRHSA
jgi:DNA-binding transcriptional LysR family regulator